MAISIEQMADIIIQELSSYTVEIAEGVKAAVDETSQELLENIKADAPELTGDYKKAMKIKTTSEDFYEKKKTWFVDAKSGEYRLTHLLENGHAKRGGGRTKAFPHIEKNEEKAQQAFTERVEGIVKNGGK